MHQVKVEKNLLDLDVKDNVSGFEVLSELNVYSLAGFVVVISEFATNVIFLKILYCFSYLSNL